MALEEREWERIEVRRDEDLLWVELNDPARANALSPRMIEEITAVYRTDLRGQGLRAVILYSAGKHFSAGADLDHLRKLREASQHENQGDSSRLRDLFESILRQEALTIALVHGACVAGGCGIATAHDFVLAADDARFMYSEVRIGFVAALVATYLPLRVRGSDLRELLLNPEFIDAERAREVGLVNRVVPRDELADAGRALAVQVLERASSESIARTKGLLLDVVGQPLPRALGHAAQVNAASRGTDDCRHGIDTFLETKQPPKWR